MIIIQVGGRKWNNQYEIYEKQRKMDGCAPWIHEKKLSLYKWVVGSRTIDMRYMENKNYAQCKMYEF